jgi:PAS domain-containing protein
LVRTLVKLVDDVNLGDIMSIPDMAARLLAETADRNGIIQFWTGGCERIFGFTAKEAVGEPLDLIIPEKLRDRHRHGHNQTMHQTESL